MYIDAAPYRAVKRQTEGPDLSPTALGRLALARVRKVLDGYVPGMPLHPGRLREKLSSPLPVPALERERLFALGWLAWLEGDDEAALTQLTEAEGRCFAVGADTAGMAELAALEANLLLARSAYWLARCRLQRGEEAIGPYEMALRKLAGSPQGTAWFVDLLWRAGRSERAEQVWKSVRNNKRILACAEGPLLTARMHLRRGEAAAAEKALREAMPRSGPAWVELHLLLAWAQVRQMEQAEQELALASKGPYPAATVAEWARLVRARSAGEPLVPESLGVGWREFVRGQELRAAGGEAAEAYRAALEVAAVVPFARYGLMCLGLESAAEVGASGPSAFLEPRLKVRQALERFLRREGHPGEVLEVIQQAERQGLGSGLMGHVRRLAQALVAREVTAEQVRELIENEVEGPARRNARRVAAELAEKHLTLDEQRELLAVLGEEGGRWRVRLALGANEVGLLEGLETPEADVARRLLAGEIPEELPAECRAVSHALGLHEAAQRGDVASIIRYLEDHAVWRELSAPPGFVVAALEAVVPTQPALHRALAGWLGLWPGRHEGLQGHLEGTAVPRGVAAGVWALHQAARSLSRGEAVAAWRHFVRAKDAGPLPEVAQHAEGAVRVRAEAEALAGCLPAGGPRGERLLGLVELLREQPQGPGLLEAALAGDAETVRRELAEWEGELPTALHHHLAVLAWREAQTNEAAMGRAWRHWLAVLPTLDEQGREVLLDHMLGWHEEQIGALVARGAMEAARWHWGMVQSLGKHGEELARRAEQFRDELATHYLVQTRESMRHGDVPKGWRADYERGLNLLRRLLSLDRDNVRLLTAITEICGEWFVDLYNTEDRAGMAEQVARHGLLINHLGRLVEGRPGELAARAALAEFVKFKGFVEPDPQARAALYREALRWDPSNANVRDLLRDLGEDVPEPTGTADEEDEDE